MRSFLLAGAISLSVVLMGCSDNAKADTQSSPPGQSIPEGAPMPKEGEVMNKDIKLGNCKRGAELFGKDSKSEAAHCKKNLGKEICEQFYDKAACQ